LSWRLRLAPLREASGAPIEDYFGAAVAPPGHSLAGQVFVTDRDAFPSQTGAIWRVDPGTGGATLVSSGGFFLELHDVPFDASGDLIATDVYSDSLIRVNPSTGAQQKAWACDLAAPAGGPPR